MVLSGHLAVGFGGSGQALVGLSRIGDRLEEQLAVPLRGNDPLTFGDRLHRLFLHSAQHEVRQVPNRGHPSIGDGNAILLNAVGACVDPSIADLPISIELYADVVVVRPMEMADRGGASCLGGGIMKEYRTLRGPRASIVDQGIQ